MPRLNAQAHHPDEFPLRLLRLSQLPQRCSVAFAGVYRPVQFPPRGQDTRPLPLPLALLLSLALVIVNPVWPLP